MPTDSGGPICIVDDDLSVQKALSRLLRLEGWKVRCFGDGEQFLHYARENGVPLLILDLSMPGLDGLEVQAIIHKVSPESQVIVITARDEDSLREAALRGGASDFFPKPFDDKELLSAMRRALEA
jgi:FixJ family two-component response regulator